MMFIVRRSELAKPLHAWLFLTVNGSCIYFANLRKFPLHPLKKLYSQKAEHLSQCPALFLTVRLGIYDLVRHYLLGVGYDLCRHIPQNVELTLAVHRVVRAAG